MEEKQKECEYLSPDAERNALTVGELILLLSKVSPDLLVTYDSGYGDLYAQEIHYNNKKVILND